MKSGIKLLVATGICSVALASGAEAACKGGSFTFTNRSCPTMSQVIICNGENSGAGTNQASIRLGQSQTFETPAGSTFTATCGIAPPQKCPAAQCVNGE
jgi:hypothetical protein